MNLLTKTAAASLLLASAGFAQIYSPSGRLSLTSNTPVMTSDVTGASTVYYVAYSGNSVILSDGTNLSNNGFASQLSLTLTSSQTATNVYDIFLFSNSGTLTLCTGPAWSTPSGSSATRGTGVGSTLLTTLKGVWVNAYAMSSCMNGSNSYSVAAQVGVYLGSVYMTANGQTSFQLHPSATSGGTNNVIGLWNAYNRVPVIATCLDANSSWTVTSSSFVEADSSGSNKISFLDGNQQSSFEARYTAYMSSNTQGDAGLIAIGLDSTSIASAIVGAQGTTYPSQPLAIFDSYPVLGLHYVAALESSPNSNNQYLQSPNGNQAQGLTLSIQM